VVDSDQQQQVTEWLSRVDETALVKLLKKVFCDLS